METGKEIASRVEQGITFDQMKERASLLRKSGFLPVTLNTDEKVLTVMLTGQELGLGFMESLRSINVVNGKPCMSAQLLIGLCHRTNQVEQAYFEKETDTEAVYVLKRKGSPEYKSSFTMEDAKRLGLSEKDNYKKQPKTMLSWRAISKAARVIFPDAVCGLYTPEEIAEEVDLVEKEGQVVVAEIHQVKIDKPEDPQKPSEPKVSPEELDFHGLANYKLKPPFVKFADMTLLQIYTQVTESGMRKGKKYLESALNFTKDKNEREIVQAFLEKADTFTSPVLK